MTDAEKVADAIRHCDEARAYLIAMFEVLPNAGEMLRKYSELRNRLVTEGAAAFTPTEATCD